VDSNRLYYTFLVFDNRISSHRLSPINILCHSSTSKGINETLFLYTDIYPTNIGHCAISHIVRILLIFSSGQTKLIAHQKHDSHNAN
jgi:hypothetical protein